MGEWQDISTANPVDGVEMLGCRKDKSGVNYCVFWLGWFAENGDPVWISGAEKRVTWPTHWQPLPAPPQ